MSDNTELKNKIESAWENITKISPNDTDCLLYTSDAADD